MCNLITSPLLLSSTIFSMANQSCTVGNFTRTHWCRLLFAYSAQPTFPKVCSFKCYLVSLRTTIATNWMVLESSFSVYLCQFEKVNPLTILKKIFLWFYILSTNYSIFLSSTGIFSNRYWNIDPYMPHKMVTSPSIFVRTWDIVMNGTLDFCFLLTDGHPLRPCINIAAMTSW